ncbi:MAG: hypothetical protein ACI4VU_00305 [Methanobrevibacter sp.]
MGIISCENYIDSKVNAIVFFLITSSFELISGGSYYILYNVLTNALNQLSTAFGALGTSNPGDYGMIIILDIIVLVLVSGLLSFCGTYLGTYLKKVYSE